MPGLRQRVRRPRQRVQEQRGRATRQTVALPFRLALLPLGFVLAHGVVFPSFIAGIASYQVATHLGVSYFHEALTTTPPVTG
jgi:hypothetical protein